MLTKGKEQLTTAPIMSKPKNVETPNLFSRLKRGDSSDSTNSYETLMKNNSPAMIKIKNLKIKVVML